MSTTTQSGTTLAILGPYLPYEIEIQVCYQLDDIEQGLLCGLMTNSRYLSVKHNDARTDSGKTINRVEMAQCLPVLYDFNDLVKPLPNGEVPAVEMAKIQWPNYNTIAAGFLDRGLIYFTELTESGVEVQQPMKWSITHLEMGWLSLHAADYLRSRHFAVGLKRDQFIGKNA